MTGMASLGDIVVDSAHPASIARFWAAAVAPSRRTTAPYDEAELDRLRGLGIDDVEDDPPVLLMRHCRMRGADRQGRSGGNEFCRIR